MDRKKLIPSGCLLFILLMPFSSGYADLGSILRKVQEAIGANSAISHREIIDGLKEALEIGTGNTVHALSQVNGYYGNPQLRIPLPQSLQKFEKILRSTGLASQLDAFVLSMNRAAENAAPEAKSLFVDAIKEMTFADADQILKGADNAATAYFKDKTSSHLQILFEPSIEQSIESVGVTRSYQFLSEKIQSTPFAGDYAIDLKAYVTEKSIDGLFIQLAEEEAKIRNDPAARVTDLLKKVFR
jgi:hypothetical protein